MVSVGLKDYLEAESVGTLGTDLFVSQMPDTPDNCFCIYDESGPTLPEMSSYDANNFGTQILVRGSFSYCKSKMFELLRKIPMLSGVYDDVQIIDTHIQNFPQFVEVDKKGRRVYSIHFLHYCNIGNNEFRTQTYTP